MISFGFNLFLSGDFEKTRKTLTEYLEFVTKNDLQNYVDMSKFYAVLMMANWYCGFYEVAIEFLGLYRKLCLQNNFDPPILIVRDQDVLDDLDLNEFFKKRFCILVLSPKLGFENLYKWLSATMSRCPELAAYLEKFLIQNV